VRYEPIEHPRWLAGSLAEARTVVRLGLGGDGDGAGRRLLDAYELAGQAATRHRERPRQRYRVMAAELCWLAGYGEHAFGCSTSSLRRWPVGDVDMSAGCMRR